MHAARIILGHCAGEDVLREGRPHLAFSALVDRAYVPLRQKTER